MKRYMILFACLATVLAACDKGFESVTEPTLTLSTAKNTFFTQEPVVFYIESDANYLSFYSGERGNDYAYSLQERIYEGEAWLSFSTAFQAGAQWKNQLEEDVEKKILRLFYSTDFAGDYTQEGVDAATWIELTGEFEFASERVDNAKVSNNTTPSGERALSELIAEEDMGKPIYFAFRYKIDAFEYDENDKLLNSRSRASVMNFNLISRCEEINATETLASTQNAGWQLVLSGYDMEADADYLPEFTGNYLWFDCSTTNNYRTCWAITAPITIDTKVNIGCDYGVGIKAFPDEPIESYTYTYAEPGEYNVSVVAAKVDHMGNRMECVESVTINVVEQGSADIEQPTDGIW